MSRLSVTAVLLAVVATAGCTDDTEDGSKAPPPAASDTRPLEPSSTEPVAIDEPADAEWTPERIRAEGAPGDPQGAISTTDSGLTTRLYEVCDGARCSHDDGPPEDLHMALEVTQDVQSAVFDFFDPFQPWVKVFDDDSVLVQDAAAWDGPVRYRLLQADGTAVELQVLDEPALADPGPGLVLIEDYNALLVGSEKPYSVDDRVGTLQPLDVPADVRFWGPNVEESLWGVTDDCRVFWASDGAFEERRLDCSEDLDFTYGINADEYPPGWLQPERMAVGEQSDDTRQDQNFVHVSLDSGSSWERVPIGVDQAVSDVLDNLD